MSLDNELIQLRYFSDINLTDKFFDSLKADYAEFEAWFIKKAEQGKKAYTLENQRGIQAFLYLKYEDEELNEVVPPQPKALRLKVGTFKVNAHGTKLGERFIKKIYDVALYYSIPSIYVTIFPKHAGLIALFERYGFSLIGTKTTDNGTENVYAKELNQLNGSVAKNFPLIDGSKNKYLLAIKPEFHTGLLPDSILKGESFDVIKDVSHTNSIHKLYISFIKDAEILRTGDIILVYRTSDGLGPAHYRSVITSVCVVEEVKTRESFNRKADFIDYCEKRSVFNQEELSRIYDRSGKLLVIRMTYNVALSKRVTRKQLIEEIGLNPEVYWGFFKIEEADFYGILKLGQVNESIVIN